MSVQGSFEIIDHYADVGWFAKGWAFDPAAPDEPVDLALWSEAGPLQSFRADLPRSDLAEAGIGGGRCAFEVRIPDQLIDGRPHRIEVVIAKEKRFLPRPTSELFFPSRLRGQVELADDGVAGGWAANELMLDRPAVLEVTANGTWVAAVTCDRDRPDIAALLGGNGRHGFEFALPTAVCDGTAQEIAIRFANTSQHVSGSPFQLRIDTALQTARRRRLESDIALGQDRLDRHHAEMAQEPLNRLADPERCRRWMIIQEATISGRLAATPVAGDRSCGIVIRLSDLAGATYSVFADRASGTDPSDPVTLLEPGTRIHPAFLPLAASAFTDPNTTIVYTDHDHVVADGTRHTPHLKPDWDPDRHRARPCVGPAVAIRRACLEAAAALVAAESDPPTDPAAWAAAVIDTALLEASPDSVAHLPYVLYHRAAPSPDEPVVPDPPPDPNRPARVQAALDRAGHAATAEPDTSPGAAPGQVRVRWHLPADPPQVTLIIPTRDRVDLLSTAVESLLRHTGYRPYGITVIDNSSTDPATLAYLDHLRRRAGVRVKHWPRAFNYAAMHNAAVAAAETPYVCLLNNDIEATDPGWLEEMMRLACRPDVGAVGAKLLYPDGTIQHGGVVVGMHGAADNAQKAFDGDEDGYLGSAQVVQNVSAVTAACLVMRRADWLAVGGMDAERFPISFNDVDLCLKLRAAGKRILWTPHAVLTHHESASRGREESPAERARAEREVANLREKWKTQSFVDPFYSPNLTRQGQSHIDFNWPAADDAGGGPEAAAADAP